MRSSTIIFAVLKYLGAWWGRSWRSWFGFLSLNDRATLGKPGFVGRGIARDDDVTLDEFPAGDVFGGVVEAAVAELLDCEVRDVGAVLGTRKVEPDDVVSVIGVDDVDVVVGREDVPPSTTIVKKC